MNPTHVRDVTEATFARDVLDRSRDVPVLVDLWASWCQPCKALTPTLEKLADEYGGRFELAKIDVDANPGLAQAFAVQSIPALKLVIDGQLADQVDGALPEAALRQFLDAHLGGPVTPAEPAEVDPLAELEALAAAGQADAALAGIREVLAALEAEAEGPERDAQLDRGHTLAARIALVRGDAAGAAESLGKLSDEGARQPEAREVGALLSLGPSEPGELETTERDLAANPNAAGPLAARGRALARAGRFDEALEALLASVRADRTHDEGSARKALLAVFDVLGPDDDRTNEYRRKLQMALFV